MGLRTPLSQRLTLRAVFPYSLEMAHRPGLPRLLSGGGHSWADSGHGLQWVTSLVTRPCVNMLLGSAL